MTVRFTDAQFDKMFLRGGIKEALDNGKLLTTSLGTTSFFGALFNDVDQNRIAASISQYVQQNRAKILSYAPDDQKKIKENLQLLQEKFSGISRQRSPDARVRAHTLIANLPPNHRTRVSYNHFLKAMTPLSILEQPSHFQTQYSNTSIGQPQVPRTVSASSKESQTKKGNKNKPSQPASRRTNGTSSAASSSAAAAAPAPSKPSSTPTFQLPPQVKGAQVSQANRKLVELTSSITLGSREIVDELPEDHPLMIYITNVENGYRNGIQKPILVVTQNDRQGLRKSGKLFKIEGKICVQYIMKKEGGPLGSTTHIVKRPLEEMERESGVKIDYNALIREQHAKVTGKK